MRTPLTFNRDCTMFYLPNGDLIALTGSRASRRRVAAHEALALRLLRGEALSLRAASKAVRLGVSEAIHRLIKLEDAQPGSLMTYRQRARAWRVWAASQRDGDASASASASADAGAKAHVEAQADAA
jgi:hypothetical protein